MRTLNVLLLLTLLALFGCGGGGGGGASAPNDFSIPTAMTLSADYPALAVGTATPTQTLGHYTDADDQDLTASVVLSSSNDSVILPVGSLLVAQNPGTAVVTATWSGGNGDLVSANMTVTVKNVTVSSVSVTDLTSAGSSVVQGEQTPAFVASAQFSDGSSQTLIYDVVWSSNDDSIATIGATTGIATGVFAGDATITASFGGQSGSTTLTVLPILVSIELSAEPSHIVLGVADSAQMIVTGTYSDGSTQVITEEAFFTHDGGIVTVIISNAAGSRGFVTGLLAVGQVNVTATVPGVDPATYELAVLTL